MQRPAQAAAYFSACFLLTVIQHQYFSATVAWNYVVFIANFTSFFILDVFLIFLMASEPLDFCKQRKENKLQLPAVKSPRAKGNPCRKIPVQD